MKRKHDTDVEAKASVSVTSKSTRKATPKKRVSSSKSITHNAKQIGVSNANSAKKGKQVEEPEEKDARNNLYWVSTLGQPCLWYGEAPTGTLRLINVTLISASAAYGNRGSIGTIIDDIDNKSATSSTLDDNIDDTRAALNSANDARTVSISRNNILPLDDEVLELYCSDPILRDFLSAVLLFAEWDDAFKPDYVWPAFIQELLTSSCRLNKWLTDCLHHSLRAICVDNRRLFACLLCAQHIGVHDEYFVDTTGTEVISCSEGLLALLTIIRDRNLDVGLEYSAEKQPPQSSRKGSTAENVVNVYFSRHSSRVGEPYQISIESLPVPKLFGGAKSSKRYSDVEAKSTRSLRGRALKQLEQSSLVDENFEDPSSGLVFSFEGCCCQGWDESGLLEFSKDCSNLAFDQIQHGEIVLCSRPQLRSDSAATAADINSADVSGSVVLPTWNLCALEQHESYSVVLANTDHIESIRDDVMENIATLLFDHQIPSYDELAGGEQDATRIQPRQLTSLVVYSLSKQDLLRELIKGTNKGCVNRETSEVTPTADDDLPSNTVREQSMAVGESDDESGILSLADDAELIPERFLSSVNTASKTSWSKDHNDIFSSTPLPNRDGIKIEYLADKHTDPGSAFAYCLTNGLQSWWQLAKDCISLRIHEDGILEMLHSCNYDGSRAKILITNYLSSFDATDRPVLNEVKQSRNNDFTTPAIHRFWRFDEFNSVIDMSIRCNRNIRRLWKKLTKDQRDSQNSTEKAFSTAAMSLITMTCTVDIYFRMFTVDDEQPVTEVIKKPRTSIGRNSTSPKSKPNGGAREIPNRWPSALPFAQHHLYWVKQTASPCICVGLKATCQPSLLKVVIISSSTYHHEIEVYAGAVEPLNLSHASIRNCSDDAFALAMISFYEWEAARALQGWSEMKWYYFPDFIYKFFQHPPSWSTWRKQVERASRGKKESKQDCYFNGLVAEMSKLPVDDLANRISLGQRWPWNDTPIQIPSPEVRLMINDWEDDALSTSSSESDEVKLDDSVSRQKPAKIPKKGIKELKSDSDSVSSNSGSSLVQITPEVKAVPKRPWSSLNLYWLPRASLPCVFYDDLEKERSDKFKVLPICCTTYHYPVDVAVTALEPLTLELLKHCTDERTQDFTIALMAFAEWEKVYQNALLAECNLNDSAGASTIDKDSSKLPSILTTNYFAFPMITYADNSYKWPAMILELIQKPREWAAWRKNAERYMLNGSKKITYFEALKREFLEVLAQKNAQLAEEAARAAEDATRMEALQKKSKPRNPEDADTKAMKLARKEILNAQKLWSPFNLYWLPRASLPCVFYDDLEKERSDKFKVLPICCTTYHYPVEVAVTAREPLTLELLKHCTDERTQDFTMALMAFAEWDVQRSNPAKSILNFAADAKPYQWPTIFLELIQKPRDFTAWRKAAERKSIAGFKKISYLRALQEDFLRANGDADSDQDSQAAVTEDVEVQTLEFHASSTNSDTNSDDDDIIEMDEGAELSYDHACGVH